jgi:F-type H+-transporting ATPase subunit a
LKTRLTILFLFILCLIGSKAPLFGQEEHGNAEAAEHNSADKPFDASTFIMEHIADAHEWHLWTKKNGEHVAIYLPVILYSGEKGLDVFSSKNLAHGHTYKGYKVEEGIIVNVNDDGLLIFPLQKRLLVYCFPAS